MSCRYYCGAARAFKNTIKTFQPFQKMTCNWNKTWTPTPLLWVSKTNSFLMYNVHTVQLITLFVFII